MPVVSRVRFWAVQTFVAFVTVASSGCGAAPGRPVLVEPNVQPPEQDIGQEDWGRMKTFAQSITNVRLEMDPLSDAVVLSYDYRTFDALDVNGAPKFKFLRMSSTLDPTHAASFSLPDNDEDAASLQCTDGLCTTVELTLTKRTGTLAGTAIVGFLRRDVSLAVAAQSTTAESPPAKLARALLSSDPVVTTLERYEVVDGLRGFFDLNLEFSNVRWKPQDDRFFDTKNAIVQGELGEAVRLRVGIGWTRGSVQEAKSGPAEGSVHFDSSRQALTIDFAPQTDGLFSLVASIR